MNRSLSLLIALVPYGLHAMEAPQSQEVSTSKDPRQFHLQSAAAPGSIPEYMIALLESVEYCLVLNNLHHNEEVKKKLQVAQKLFNHRYPNYEYQSKIDSFIVNIPPEKIGETLKREQNSWDNYSIKLKQLLYSGKDDKAKLLYLEIVKARAPIYLTKKLPEKT